MYSTALSLQAALLIVIVLVGAKKWELPLGLVLLGSALITPVWLLRPTPGATGLLYLPDLIVLAGALHLAPRSGRRLLAETRAAPVLWLAAFCLVLWPLVSTALSAIVASTWDPRLIALVFWRSLGYLVVFGLGWQWGARRPAELRVLALQMASLVVICIIGIAQFVVGFNLDLWNELRGLNPGEYSGGFGGGFMGLYRGAVGAWCACMLALAPFIALRARSWLVSAVVMITALLGGIVIAGSRQGLIVGVLALGIGTLVVPFAGRSRRRRVAVGRGTALVVMVIGLGIALSAAIPALHWTGPATRRFATLFEGDLAEIVTSRHQSVPEILRSVVVHPYFTIVGRGDGRLVPHSGGDDFALIYVDSEWLWELQRGGVILMAAYALLVWRLYRIYRTASRSQSEERRLSGMAGIVLLGAIVALSFGHFGLLHAHSSHAPVGYWQWFALGYLAGCSRALTPAANASLTGGDIGLTGSWNRPRPGQYAYGGIGPDSASACP